MGYFKRLVDWDSALITVLEVIWFSLKHTSVDHTLSIGIDLLFASVFIDIDS